ncbi:MAG: DUF559 domain-containing protein [Actinomycetota bacterium]
MRDRQRARQLLWATAEVQFGLFNLAQARAAGITRGALHHLINTRALMIELPRVYALSGAPKSWHRSLMAVCLWAGEKSAASHRSAAALWGFDGFGMGVVEISTARPQNAPRPGMTVHRVDSHLLDEIVTVNNIPTTSVPRTLLDLCAIKHARAEGALDHALTRRVTTLEQMWLFHDQEWLRGRRGIRVLRHLLIERTPGKAPTQGELERMMKRLITAEAFPEPVRQHEVILSFGPVHIDFAYPERKLGIETDDYGSHGNPKSFDRDRERDAELQAMGWRILRFTWAQLRWRPDYVSEMIRHQLQISSIA